jgi:hypothetical protein
LGSATGGGVSVPGARTRWQIIRPVWRSQWQARVGFVVAVEGSAGQARPAKTTAPKRRSGLM